MVDAPLEVRSAPRKFHLTNLGSYRIFRQYIGDLLQEADLYLMDEPFAGVDAATERAIVDVLRDLQQAGKTALVVHHDLQTVTDYFDWVIMLNMRVVTYGCTNEVFTDENLQKTYGGRLTVLSQAAQAMADQRRGR